MPFMTMEHAQDPVKSFKESIGDLAGIEIFNNQVLVATYIRPTKTKSGLYLPDQMVDEDKFQSKVGLVLKKGPSAFVETDESQWFHGITVELDDWIVFRPSDGWNITVNNVTCRILNDVAVRGRVDHPDRVW